MPVRDKVYEKMKSFGLTDSKEDFYKYYDNDENVRKDVFKRLQEDGLTDTEEEFYKNTNNFSFRDEKQYTRLYCLKCDSYVYSIE